MTRLYAVTAATVVAALIGVTLWYTLLRAPDDRFAACRTGTVAGGAGALGGPFTLVDQTGRTVTERDIITRPTLLYFGYTFCPDVCPLDTTRNAEAVDILEERGFEVTPAFISVDPDRDTPDQLANFAGNLHPRMIAMTGTEAQVKAASQAWRTYFRIHDKTDDYYLVDHSTFTYLVLPAHGTVAFFRRDLGADALADQVVCYLERA